MSISRTAKRALAALAGALCVTAALASAETAGAASTTATPGIFWGASIGPQLTGGEAPYDLAAIPAFEHNAHKALSIVGMGWPFATCAADNSCQPFPFPSQGLADIRAAGAIPTVSLQTAPTTGGSDPVTLKGIIAGKWDSYLARDAQEIRAYGHPFFLRLDWEMNGNWYPWSPGVDGSTATQFVAAWRHIHNVFTRAGDTNVTWVWCPNVAYTAHLRALYPGDHYVDWTCLDGYNWGDRSGEKWQSWNQVYRRSYDLITKRIAPTKPMMIGEFASSTFGGNKTAWIANALAEVPAHYPKIRALLYYDFAATDPLGFDFAINTTASSQRAFSRGIARRAYVTNRYANLPDGPIAPPVT